MELRWRALGLHDDNLRRVPCAAAAALAADTHAAASRPSAALSTAALSTAALSTAALALALAAASVPMRDLLEDLREMRRGQIRVEPSHVEVRGPIHQSPDLPERQVPDIGLELRWRALGLHDDNLR